MWHSLNMGFPKIWIGYFKLLYKHRETKRLAMSKGNHSSWRFVLMIWMGTGYWFRSKKCHELGWIFWGNPPRPWRSKSLRKKEWRARAGCQWSPMPHHACIQPWIYCFYSSLMSANDMHSDQIHLLALRKHCILLERCFMTTNLTRTMSSYTVFGLYLTWTYM